MSQKTHPAKSAITLGLLFLAGLMLLLGCSTAQTSSEPSPTENPTANLRLTQTAVAAAFDADLASGKTAVAIANTTAVALRETAAAEVDPDAPLPTPPAIEVPAMMVPTPASVNVPAGSERTAQDTLAQLELEHPARLSAGSSSVVNALIYIPPELASQSDEFIEIEYPVYRPPIMGPADTLKSPIYVRPQMRLDLSSPGAAFTIERVTLATQTINLQPGAPPAVWTWTLVAPAAANTYLLKIDMYRDDGLWSDARLVYVQVEAPTATPTPILPATATSSPTFTATPAPPPTLTPTPVPPPFFDTPGGVAVIGAAGTVFAALVTGLISFFVARDSFPVFGHKASYRRTLQTLQGNLAQLEHRAAQYGPLDVPLKLQNEIEATRQQIADVEAKLNKLESK